eukprot:COSAG04_NODE_1271_length_7472_cov_2.824766_5_plen_184_part_00
MCHPPIAPPSALSAESSSPSSSHSSASSASAPASAPVSAPAADVVDWAALWSDEGDECSLFAEEPECFLRERAREPARAAACTESDSEDEHCCGDGCGRLAVWSPPAHAEADAEDLQENSAGRLLMRLPNNFRELDLTREQWQSVWEREYAQWQQGVLGAEQMIADAQQQRELRLVATGSYIW